MLLVPIEERKKLTFLKVQQSGFFRVLAPAFVFRRKLCNLDYVNILPARESILPSFGGKDAKRLTSGGKSISAPSVNATM